MAVGTDTFVPRNTASPGKKFLSRLRSSSFSSRSRTLTEFYVRPLEPHRQHAPGDIVKGAVVFTVSKPIRVTHLTVALGGYVRVFRNGGTGESIAGDTPTHASRGRSNGEYFGNGFASLFQDEVVLCGEGRLDAGVYEFNFELEFPSRGLPSSIDFERGTISYMVTSTMTRPIAISPTTTCSRKVQLLETVDVGPLRPPKPRLITLEPIVKRTKTRSSSKRSSIVRRRSTDSKTPTLDGSAVQGTSPSETPSDSASINTAEVPPPPRSPALSEESEESRTTASTGSFRLSAIPSVGRSSKKSSQCTRDNTLEKKTITATIEVLRGGCLRGGSLPVKVSINHNKTVKSLYGIIVTLYRQARIDSHPILPIGPTGKTRSAGQATHEDYYPKSKTGLGGLSLSSAGSSHTFRKDISQTFAPLIVDPRTLTAVVKASVRVPEDAFPSISSVPGAMISFRYYVEVVVDLGGKLAGQERFLPRSDGPQGPLPTTRNEDGVNGVLPAWGGNVMETDQIRREKGVVASVFEVLVGSTDSTRGRKAMTSDASDQEGRRPDSPDSRALSAGEDPSSDEHGVQYGDWQDHDHSYDWDPNAVRPYPGDVPPPDIPEEDEMDEKTRMRQAEERLLPSQPPVDGEGPSSLAPEDPPSAPVLQDHDSRHCEDPSTPGPPSQFTYDPLSSSSAPQPAQGQQDGRPISPNEDKQELERQRLAAGASAPSNFPDDDEHHPGADGPSLPPSGSGPSAPVLTTEDEYAHAYDHNDAHRALYDDGHPPEHLPQYER